MKPSLYEGVSEAFEASGDLVELRETLAYCKRLGMGWVEARKECLDLYPNFRPPPVDDRYDEEHWLEFLWRHLRCAYNREPAERPCVECDELTLEQPCWRCKPTNAAHVGLVAS